MDVGLFDIIRKLSEAEFIFLIVICGVAFYKAFELYLKFKETELVLKEKESQKEKPSEPIKLEVAILDEFQKIDKYLYNNLERAYKSFAFRKLIPILKEYSSIAEGNRMKYRKEFLDFFDFITTEEEKELYKYRFPRFDQFKFILIDFFNNKTTKLELLVINKLEINKEEFQDWELYKSLFNNLSDNEIKNISDIIQNFSNDNENTKG